MDIKDGDVWMHEESGRLLYVVDSGTGSILCADAITGERGFRMDDTENCKLLCRGDDASEMLKEIQRLWEDNVQNGRLIERLGELLTGVAAALKGPPPEDTLHDWSDLPRLSAETKAALDAADELVGALRALVSHNSALFNKYDEARARVQATLDRHKE